MLPLIYLTGTAYEQGLQHGTALRERIYHNLEIYFERFKHEAKLTRAEVLSWAQHYAGAIAAQNSDYYAAMQGIAAGATCSFYEIVALNIRYEIMYYQDIHNATKASLSDGCTSFAVGPTKSANGHLLIGENWDWINQILGAVLHTTEPNGLQTLGFTEAGIVGAKIGLNTVGLGLVINGISSVDDDWRRLEKPFHLRCYEILRQQTFHDALAVITHSPRACSANYLIAQAPDQVVNIEAAPKAAYNFGLVESCLVHSNHFLDPMGALNEPASPYHDGSYQRYARLNGLLRSPQAISISMIQQYLQDHTNAPNSICYHGYPQGTLSEQYSTLTSVIMDLHERAMYITDGLPCQNEYQRIALA